MLNSRLLVSLLALTATACSVDDDEYSPSAPPEESDSWGEGGKEDAPSPGPEVPAAEQSPDIGQFFMVDHYGVTATGYADIRNKIKTKNLGAIILWNPTNASGETLRTMIRGYSEVAAEAGRDELFYASDQEEQRTQRFSSAHGFTALFAGNILGNASNVERICELHARITAREMASTGMNMSLGTVSDLYISDSGTRGMFRTRAVDSDPNVVGPCIVAMARAYAEEQHVVFITKHFPGLGNATGNTDVDASVRTRSTTKTAMERELAPYRLASQAVTEADGWNYFGAMISHASYPILDGTNTPGTLSSTIVSTFLRGAPNQQLALGGKDGSGASPTFAGMGFRGLTVSDAFWTWGATRGLTPIQRQRLMARAFLAGNDILMIAKSDFNGAWGYFQLVYADRMPAAEKQALAEATGMSWDALRAKFRARIEESAARIREAKAAVGRSTTFTGSGPARNASSDLTSEYRSLGG